MHHETTGREFILETATKLFNQKDYKDVSIRDIAGACGMTNATLYYHFKNKEDLFLSVLQRNHQRVTASLNEAAQAEGDLRERLQQMVTRYAYAMCEQRQSIQTLWRDLNHLDQTQARKLFGEMRSGLMRPLQQLIESAQLKHEIEKGDVRLYAHLLEGMIIALTYPGKSGHQVPPAQADVDVLVDVFLKGVGR